jgi:N-acetylgalactosamine-N,N'-diacetylbacillosaminyl-diphospho-undecaprenol 4-alpha-N-acetylgalactosaminyltransferase
MARRDGAVSGRPILFVINSLAGGGAERVFAAVTRHLDGALGAPMEVVLLDDAKEAYALPETVPKAVLACGGSMAQSVAALTAHARRRKPRAIVSFLARANCAAVVAAAACGAPAVISERVHTTSHFAGARGRALNKAAVRALYPRAARVIAVSRGVADDLAARYAVPRARIVTIHNPVDLAAIRKAGAAPPAVPLPETFIAASGRLTPNKNFAMLLNAYAASGVRMPLVILGEGPERARLMNAARALGVADRVLLPGHLANPFAVIARAALFVSSSNAEGFPNALIEAMALARPVIAADCPAGPAEIVAGDDAMTTRAVREARWGVLTPAGDAAAMAGALRLMDEGKRRAFGARAAERAAHFSAERALGAYRDVICGAMQPAERRR